MATIGDIEEQIYYVEGFQVRISGDPDEEALGEYEYERKAPGKWTVSHWKKVRFDSNFPDWDVSVNDDDGGTAQGNKILENIRPKDEEPEPIEVLFKVITLAVELAGKAIDKMPDAAHWAKGKAARILKRVRRKK